MMNQINDGGRVLAEHCTDFLNQQGHIWLLLNRVSQQSAFEIKFTHHSILRHNENIIFRYNEPKKGAGTQHPKQMFGL